MSVCTRAAISRTRDLERRDDEEAKKGREIFSKDEKLSFFTFSSILSFHLVTFLKLRNSIPRFFLLPSPIFPPRSISFPSSFDKTETRQILSRLISQKRKFSAILREKETFFFREMQSQSVSGKLHSIHLH